jgi:NAD(P)-dependent dehydrogenase (short-subunit alcohol dehydrogenase family)
MVDEDESVDLSFGLKGKVTVVTGGAAGIGAAIPRWARSAGWERQLVSVSSSSASSRRCDARCQRLGSLAHIRHECVSAAFPVEVPARRSTRSA